MKLTKKLITIICIFSMIATLTACGKQSIKTGNSASSGAATSASSGAAISASGGAASTASSKAGTSSAAPRTTAVGYRHKTMKYLYQKNNKDYTANYPQLSEEAPNYKKANDLMENTGLKTILSMGLQKTDATMEVKVRSDLTYYNTEFISATFDETSSVSTAAHPNAEFRTVNFDLKKGTAVTTADMIVKNDALNALLLTAAKKKVDNSMESQVTAAVIKKGMESCSIYFTKTSVGFSLVVPHALGDHLEVTIRYNDIKPFITTNALWKNIIVK
jgi:hypothetical protein